MRPLTNGYRKDLGAKASDSEEAMNALVRLLSARERSVQEAHNRLLGKGYSPESSLNAIERAVGCGLLDDQRFAEGLIKDRISAGWGRRRIDADLHLFGIVRESIEGYPEAFFNDDEQLEQALFALRRHHSRSKNPRQAAYRHLMGKGYSSDIANAAIRRLEDEGK